MAPPSKKKVTSKQTASTPAPKKPATAKKASSAEKAPEKPAIANKASSAEKAPAKPAARKPAARANPRAATPSLSLTQEERWRMIAVTAYHKAERRGFAPGNEVQDWLEAEQEVDGLVSGAL